jgi:cyclohexa-1,5-dienecarbonyl-CoA hydratase
VRVEFRGPAAFVTLAHPPLNVLDLPTIDALVAALEDLAGRRDAKVVVLRSAIAGTFSAGVDVAAHAPEQAGAMLEAFHRVFRILEDMPQLTVAAVDGRCLGGGCELAVFCDVVLATKASVFAQPEIDVGCFPPVAAVLLPRLVGRAAVDGRCLGGGCELAVFCDVVLATKASVFALPEIDVGCFPPVAAVLLPRLIGRAAVQMILTGAPVDAAEAARTGLITRVVPDLDAEIHRWTAAVAAKSGAVVAIARRAMRGEGAFAAALARAERLYLEELVPTADCAEGVRAFLEKRPPVWTDR